MLEPLSILFATSEAYPFAKYGGLADVSFSLPLAIKEKGHDIRMILTKYQGFNERKHRIYEINRLSQIPLNFNNKEEIASVSSSSIHNSKAKVQTYITTLPAFFELKRGLYSDPETDIPYKDNAERFIIFNFSILHTCLLLGWIPDVIHCNNWTTALLPALIKNYFPEEFSKTKTVLTVHNFSHSQEFDIADIDSLGLPKEIIDSLIVNGKVNFLKSGIEYADCITTVSESYKDEVLNNSVETLGLHSQISNKKDHFYGIMNGIDSYVWNPMKDPIIVKNFNEKTPQLKVENKIELCSLLGIEYKPEVPIFAFIRHFSKEKGIDLLIESLPQLVKTGAVVVILGEGEVKYKTSIDTIAKKHQDQIHCFFEFNETLAHKIEAGSDIFLNLSKVEPCGLNHLYSLGYGTVPIAYNTGGIKETYTDFLQDEETGAGFKFQVYSVNDLMNTIEKALKIYKNTTLWSKIINNGMTLSFQWNKSAEEYLSLYTKLLNIQ
jgi:starch synthase